MSATTDQPTDQPTHPTILPAFVISTPEELRRQRRKGIAYRTRRADLEQAAQPGALRKDQARTLAARMSAWPDRWPEEHEALRELMRRHGLTAAQILDEQRRTGTGR